MKVLLVKPNLGHATLAGNDFVELEPLELEYLAAGIPHHDVRLIDMRYDNDLDDTLTRFRPDIVAATAYSVHFKNVLGIMRTARRLDPNVFTVIGGHHATLLPNDFDREEIDAVVIGEGVFSFAELVNNLKRNLPLEAIPGLAIRHRDKFHFTKPRADIGSIDLLPLPNRKITEKHRKKYFYLWWKPAALIRASIGCAYRCSFCPIWSAANGRCEYRSPEAVADELRTVKENFVYFCDDNAFHDYKKMKRLGRIIKEEKINKEYFFFSRPDTLLKHPDLVEDWAGIGLRQVFIGVEVLDTEKMRSLHKYMEADSSREAIRILNANGIDPFAAFMVFPDFSEDDFRRILDYMDEMKIYFNEVTVLTPAPGSELYFQEKANLISDDYDLYDYLHAVLPTKLHPREFYRHLANLYIKAYSPSRAIRAAPHFRPALTPRRLMEIVRKGSRNYFSIRNAWKSFQ